MKKNKNLLDYVKILWILLISITEDYSSEQVYRIIKDSRTGYTDSFSFIIIINTSTDRLIDYGEEYDALKFASDVLIDKYNSDYGLDIGIIYKVYFLENEEYEKAKEVLEHYHSRISIFDDYFSSENKIYFATDNNSEKYVWVKILSREEYINEREHMKWEQFIQIKIWL